MNKKRIAIFSGVFFILAFIIIALSYFYIKLVPSLTTLSTDINTLSILLIPAYMMLGIFYLYLLVIMLKHITSIEKKLWIHSLLIVFIVLSGASILADATLVNDIFKEYLYFDVNGEWVMIFINNSIRIVTFIYAFVVTMNVDIHNKKLFSVVKKGCEQLFISMIQIVLFSSIIGLSLLLMVMLNSNTITQTYRLQLSCIYSIISILPILMFAIYWIIRFRKYKIKDWLDEQEHLFLLRAILIAMIIGWIVIFIGFVISFYKSDFEIRTWLLIVLFMQLIIIAFSVLFPVKMITTDNESQSDQY